MERSVPGLTLVTKSIMQPICKQLLAAMANFFMSMYGMLVRSVMDVLPDKVDFGRNAPTIILSFLTAIFLLETRHTV
jgi:hypothetical protein